MPDPELVGVGLATTTLPELGGVGLATTTLPQVGGVGFATDTTVTPTPPEFTGASLATTTLPRLKGVGLAFSAVIARAELEGVGIATASDLSPPPGTPDDDAEACTGPVDSSAFDTQVADGVCDPIYDVYGVCVPYTQVGFATIQRTVIVEEEPGTDQNRVAEVAIRKSATLGVLQVLHSDTIVWDGVTWTLEGFIRDVGDEFVCQFFAVKRHRTPRL